MIIIGINAYHGDSSVCIFINESLLLQLKRKDCTSKAFRWSSNPLNKILLDFAKIDISDVDYFTINRNPKKRIYDKLKFIIRNKTNIFQI